MAQRPLLFFPSKEVATRSKLGGGGGKYYSPPADRQGERLSPKFKELFDALDAQRATIQSSITGIDPEQVLVFETIGSIENFANAVSKIRGFEWLGEIEVEDIIPDDDFFPINKFGEKVDNKLLNGRLYLVMTNTAAMNQLLSLWNQYVQNPSISFENGKGKFKNVFKLLRNIRKWGVEDRFEESNVLRLWEEDLQIDPNRVVRFEIELWYRSRSVQRQQSFNSVARLVTDSGGRIISSCDIPEICYHAALAELPANEIHNILSNRNTELVKCEYIMYFKPSGQIVMDDYSADDAEILEHIHDFAQPSGNPIVAIFDGYPLSRHVVLDNRLIIDDPDDMESHYQVGERKHGTAMCSLIVRGDLNNDEEPLPTPLYVRPIMYPNERDIHRNEYVPNDTLFIDTIHRAVKRIFEGEGSTEAVAPSIKIINLSIGDRDRLFYTSMSPWGKLLDWLSYKYGVLFIVSTGNHYNSIQLSIPKAEFESLAPIEKEKLFITEILNNSRNCRIMSPAESINSITVGALHIDNATFHPNEHRLNPYSSALPSTYTAFGGGYRRAIKPDLVYYGGRQMFDYHYNDNSILTPSNLKISPGLQVAAPDNTLNRTIHEIGTSNSTALISRNGYFCHEVLQELFEDNNINISNDKIALLIKTMLIHGCSWDTIGNEIERRLDGLDARTVQGIKRRWIGYGFPDIIKVKECTEQRATVIGFGELKEEEAHVYNLPLPPSLASQTIKRRLTITLAWFSPISSHTQRYRTARLWFEVKNSIVDNRINADWQAVRRGTIQHEIFEDSTAAAFIDGNAINIKINCSKDANSFSESIAYAVLVSLEVAEGIDLPIYQEIKERISIAVPISQRL